MRHAILLRAISNAQMAPYRAALERLGLEDVESFGASGNFLATAAGPAPRLEERITRALGTDAIIRTRPQLLRVAREDPHARTGDGAITFLKRRPTTVHRRAFEALDLVGDPILSGRELYYRSPLRKRGRKSPLDVEKELGVRGTFRTSRVVAKLAERIVA